MRRGSGATLSIIAGGRGSRLGGVAKGLLRLGGRTLLERQLELAPLFEDVLLVTPDPEPYAAFGLRTVADVVPGKGAPGGVHAALCAARTPWVMALACDMPFVSGPVVEALLAARGEEVDVVCFEASGRLEPLLALYRASIVAGWGAALADDPSFAQLFQRFRTRVLPEAVLRAVDPSLGAVANANSPGDLARWGILPPDGGGAGGCSW